MKKRKIIGIILILLGLLCVYGAFSVNAGAPVVAEIIRNAVYVSDGKVLAENEGKVVIVPGTLDADPFVDQETGIRINSIVSYREVEKLTVIAETEDDKEYEYWSWEQTGSQNAYGGSKKLFAPNITLGEFHVSEDLIEHVSLAKHRDEYNDKKELNQRGWHRFLDNGKAYLYTGDYMPDDGDTYGRLYADCKDTLRVSYREMDGGLDYTIVAVQQNGKLVRVPDVTLQALHTGHLSQDDILATEESTAKSATVIAIVGAVLCLGAGAFLLIRKETQEKKNKKKAV